MPRVFARVTSLLVFTIVLGGCSRESAAAPSQGGDTPAAAPSPKGTRKVSFNDPAYGMEAATVSIPRDWLFAGTVARPGGCTAVGPSLKFTAQSKDGLSALATMPGFAWSWSADPNFAKLLKQQGCAVSKLTSAAGFLKEVALPNLRPGAQVSSIEPPKPENQAKLAARLAQMQQQSAQMAAQYGQKAPQTILEGARAHVRSTREGHEVDEIISTVVMCSITEMLGGGYPMRPVERHQCSASVVVIARAPAGQMDQVLPLLEQISASTVQNPAWSQRLAHDMQQAAQQSLDASRAAGQQALANGAAAQKQRDANHAANMKQQQERVDHAMANERATQAAIDHSAQQTIEMVQGNREYVNPTTGEKVVASGQYNHSWQSGDGQTVVHTNDAAYDPNGRDNQTWTELSPSR